ncbi:spore gernimation protein GerC [Bacillus sp. FJAT-18019]|uniref:Spore gernimation protein GerC n=1 Tax=Paenibacillus solani TaxID=1705565 RepID=A0A0M1P6C5_9BACL|nr:Ger(x)C family spore germination protein [Paenibacillus solani]KOP68063.1 spore gernimation protein GerC [Bacillus sp. FJAT-18019]KOR89599.1 spore gernimation protein GerC [Paenibacillus solani]
MRSCISIIKFMWLMIVLNMLTGCWDIKEVQDMNYITAIGIDQEDGNFIVYTQMMDFSSVAKSESGKTDKPVQVWTSKTSGKTFDMAINAMYNSAQVRTSWSHVSCILISNNVLKSNVLTKLDTIGRYQEIRMTPWVYGTEESIEHLFNVPAFFNLSPLNTLAHEPAEEYKQRSYILPLRYFDFMSLMTEPATTVLLPSLSVDNKTWSLNQKENPKLTINGVFAISKGVSKGLFTNDKLTGLRWLETSTKRSPLPITNKNGEYAGVVVLTKPKVRKKLDIVNGIPKYRVHVKLHGNVVEALNDLNKTQLEKLVASEVRDEILATFKNGVAVDTDLYSLEHVLFKKDTHLWKNINKSSAQPIDPDTLATVHVEVHLDHAGMKLLHHHNGPITPDAQYETDY